MVAYDLYKTLTENGHVARGVCEIDGRGFLTGLRERTRIEKKEYGTAYTEDDGKTWNVIPAGSTVSMNMWAFSESILKELKDRFPVFLKNGLEENPLKCEYFLPNAVGDLVKEGKASVAVLKSTDRWYGVTYKEDKEVVVNAIRQFRTEGMYPDKLWD